ncbi:MAG TPA: hypothetical protein VF240_16095 [Pyrinomonadaceae bacterium]
MRLRLYCNRYGHFKDALVCSVNCVYRTRCHDFALYYDAHRAEVDAEVTDYYDARREGRGGEAASARGASVAGASADAPARAPKLVTPVEMRALIRLEVKREMSEVVFIWVDKDDRAELVETPEVLRRAERGQKPKHIYKVSQEMELRYQLVPRKSIDRAKRAAAVDEERAVARRRARTQKTPPAPVPFPAPVPAAQHDEASAAASPARRTRARSRVAKIAGR